MKKLAVVLMALLMLTASAAMAETALEEIQARGTLTIAMEGAWQPWTYHDESGALTGFDVEVGALIAEGLGVTPDYMETAWDGILAGVDSGRFDIACNGVGYTETRAEKYSFSTPYVYTHKVLVVAEKNEEIKTIDDLAGKTLQHLFVSDITHKMISRLLVNHTDMCTSLLEFLGDAAPYALRSACHNGYFIFKNHAYCGI